MKSIFPLVTLVYLLGFSPVQAQNEQPFSLEGKITGLSPDAMAYLVYAIHTNPITDSVQINDGKFTFSGTLNGPEKAYLIVNHNGQGVGKTRDMLEIFISPGSHYLPTVDSIKHLTFEAGTANADYQALQKQIHPITSALRQVGASLGRSPNDEALLAQHETLQKERRETYLNFIRSNPGSIASIEALYNYAGPVMDVNDVEPIYRTLHEAIRTSYPGQLFANELAARKTISSGQPAVDFAQQTPDGATVRLTDFRGQYVLLDFWASWCKPCRAENPNLVAAYQQYNDRGFTILGISLDNPKGRDAWLKAIEDDGLTWIQVSDLQGWKNEVAQLYHVRSIPQNFLIDPAGNIVATNLRGDELLEKLKEIL